MMAHNYAINDDVHHQLQGPQGRAVVKQRSVYTIVTCLPIEADGRPRYRIKSKTENVERVVTEEQISRLGQGRASEFLEPHRLAEQIALDQVETHLVRRDKIGAGLDSLGNDPGAVPLGEFDDVTAYRLFQPVVGAAGDELPIDLEFDEREGVEPHQRRPVGTNIV